MAHACQEGSASHQAPIKGAGRRRAHIHEDLLVLRSWSLHVLELKDFRPSIPFVDYHFHNQSVDRARLSGQIEEGWIRSQLSRWVDYGRKDVSFGLQVPRASWALCCKTPQLGQIRF